MSNEQNKDSEFKSYSIDVIFNVFRILSVDEEVMKAFLDECRSRSLVIEISGNLSALAKDSMMKIPSAKLAYQGGDCPACPAPRQ